MWLLFVTRVLFIIWLISSVFIHAETVNLKIETPSGASWPGTPIILTFNVNATLTSQTPLRFSFQNFSSKHGKYCPYLPESIKMLSSMQCYSPLNPNVGIAKLNMGGCDSDDVNLGVLQLTPLPTYVIQPEQDIQCRVRVISYSQPNAIVEPLRFNEKVYFGYGQEIEWKLNNYTNLFFSPPQQASIPSQQPRTTARLIKLDHTADGSRQPYDNVTFTDNLQITFEHFPSNLKSLIEITYMTKGNHGTISGKPYTNEQFQDEMNDLLLTMLHGGLYNNNNDNNNNNNNNKNNNNINDHENDYSINTSLSSSVAYHSYSLSCGQGARIYLQSPRLNQYSQQIRAELYFLTSPTYNATRSVCTLPVNFGRLLQLQFIDRGDLDYDKLDPTHNDEISPYFDERAVIYQPQLTYGDELYVSITLPHAMAKRGEDCHIGEYSYRGLIHRSGSDSSTIYNNKYYIQPHDTLLNIVDSRDSGHEYHRYFIEQRIYGFVDVLKLVSPNYFDFQLHLLGFVGLPIAQHQGVDGEAMTLSHWLTTYLDYGELVILNEPKPLPLKLTKEEEYQFNNNNNNNNTYESLTKTAKSETSQNNENSENNNNNNNSKQITVKTFDLHYDKNTTHWFFQVHGLNDNYIHATLRLVLKPKVAQQLLRPFAIAWKFMQHYSPLHAMSYGVLSALPRYVIDTGEDDNNKSLELVGDNNKNHKINNNNSNYKNTTSSPLRIFNITNESFITEFTLKPRYKPGNTIGNDTTLSYLNQTATFDQDFVLQFVWNSVEVRSYDAPHPEECNITAIRETQPSKYNQFYEKEEQYQQNERQQQQQQSPSFVIEYAYNELYNLQEQYTNQINNKINEYVNLNAKNTNDSNDNNNNILNAHDNALIRIYAQNVTLSDKLLIQCKHKLHPGKKQYLISKNDEQQQLSKNTPFFDLRVNLFSRWSNYDDIWDDSIDSLHVWNIEDKDYIKDGGYQVLEPIDINKKQQEQYYKQNVTSNSNNNNNNVDKNNNQYNNVISQQTHIQTTNPIDYTSTTRNNTITSVETTTTIPPTSSTSSGISVIVVKYDKVNNAEEKQTFLQEIWKQVIFHMKLNNTDILNFNNIISPDAYNAWDYNQDIVWGDNDVYNWWIHSDSKDDYYHHNNNDNIVMNNNDDDDDNYELNALSSTQQPRGAVYHFIIPYEPLIQPKQKQQEQQLIESQLSSTTYPSNISIKDNYGDNDDDIAYDDLNKLLQSIIIQSNNNTTTSSGYHIIAKYVMNAIPNPLLPCRLIWSDVFDRNNNNNNVGGSNTIDNIDFIPACYQSLGANCYSSTQCNAKMIIGDDDDGDYELSLLSSNTKGFQKRNKGDKKNIMNTFINNKTKLAFNPFLPLHQHQSNVCLNNQCIMLNTLESFGQNYHNTNNNIININKNKNNTNVNTGNTNNDNNFVTGTLPYLLFKKQREWYQKWDKEQQYDYLRFGYGLLLNTTTSSSSLTSIYYDKNKNEDILNNNNPMTFILKRYNITDYGDDEDYIPIIPPNHGKTAGQIGELIAIIFVILLTIAVIVTGVLIYFKKKNTPKIKTNQYGEVVEDNNVPYSKL